MKKVFITPIYSEQLLKSKKAIEKLNKQILLEAEDIASLDTAGQKWSKDHYQNGYTSYGSANALQEISPTFLGLQRHIDKHVAQFAKILEFNLGGQPLKMVSCWLNQMNKNTHHSMHLHPLSVISGTYYVNAPKGTSPLKFEDPRIGSFMCAPPKKPNCREENRTHIEVPAKTGNLVLFEGWLKHEVPMITGEQQRVSVSFNYAW